MKLAAYTILAAFLFTFFNGPVCSQDLSVSDYLLKSDSQEQAGNFEEALETLFEARTTLQTPSLKIANEYLRIVTKHEASKYYRMAYAMYRWGLSADDVEPNKQALTSEIERLKPIAADSMYSEWVGMLDDEDPRTYDSILAFWDYINFMPLPNYNPRLLEHWKRIGFARKNYNTESLDPYDTDIRGLFYVKYGPPNKTKEMDLAIEASEVQAVFSNLSIFTEPGFAIQNRGLIDKISTYQKMGKVKIWTYKTQAGDQDLDLHLFFREKPGGKIERVRVIDDLIPSSAFRGGGRSAGVVMQWVYYNRLRNYDPDFASIYSSMENDFFSEKPVRFSVNTGMNFKFMSRARAESDLKYAPDIVSTDRKSVIDIPINARQYRLLNEDGEPIFVTYVENRPLKALYFDLIQNSEKYSEYQDSLLEEIEDEWNEEIENKWINIENDRLENYHLRNTVHLRDADMRLISSSYSNPVLVIDHDDENLPSTSVFKIPHIEEGAYQIFFAELQNNDRDTSPAFETTLPPNLRGLGEIRIPQPEHFDVEPGKLIASDLILGYQKHEFLRETDLFPFIVATNNTLPQDEPLVVHFEVYQLGMDSRGFSRFEVEYKFSSVSRFFNLFGKTIQGISSVLEFENEGDRFNESLEIETGSLDPGTYDLDFSITDKMTGQKIKRSARFEVKENSDFYMSSY